ncbi:MAG: PbpA [Desulfobacterales bacterium]|nr:MAG: PbpA [Desulfobacterales bacterium]
MMPQRLKTNPTVLARPTWREYQTRLKKTAQKARRVKKTLKISALCLVLLVLSYGFIAMLNKRSFTPALSDYFVSSEDKINDTRVDQTSMMNKRDLQVLAGNYLLDNLENERFEFVSNNAVFRVDTSIDTTLQNFLKEKADKSIARNMGIVCMHPDTGKILSMVGFNKIDPLINPCVGNKFPAASIFKIITAAAAVEQRGLNLKSKLSFNGRKHTLYKKQLKEQKNKYTNYITFKDSFAQSVNPVFGKIGSLYLGKEILEAYALAFGFNRTIDFEIKLNPSVFSISEDPYQWAEIASGFNHETNITPLHGALIASVIINQGKLIEPTIIEQVIDEKEQVVYHSDVVTIRQAIAPETSTVVSRLMEETVKAGTFRKTFRGYKQNKILSKLNIGGKSGSIASQSNDVRYDWFVGFAKEKNGQGKIAIAVLVTHHKYIGKRAGYFARIAMEQYFNNKIKTQVSDPNVDGNLQR